jgi:hypothetical protein
MKNEETKLERDYLEFIHTLLRDEENEKSQIQKLYEVEDWSEIKNKISRVEQIKKIKEDINQFLETKYNLYKNEINREGNNNSKLTEEVYIEEFVDTRTNKRKVRIKTDKGNDTYYSNVLSIKLFNMIIMEIVYSLEQYKYVRTNDIVRKLKKSIEEESEYKNHSTYRVPVYSCFKYLISIEILTVDPNNKHKYLLNKEKDIEEVKELMIR